MDYSSFDDNSFSPLTGDEPFRCYDPTTVAGLRVPATVLGVLGLTVAIVGTLIGLGIWFDVDFKWWKVVDKLNNRFTYGLIVILLANIYGILILAVGKLFHFARNVQMVSNEMRNEQSVQTRHLAAIASSFQATRPAAE